MLLNNKWVISKHHGNKMDFKMFRNIQRIMPF